MTSVTLSMMQRNLFTVMNSSNAVQDSGKPLKDIILEDALTVRIAEVLPGTGSLNIPHYLSRIDALGDPNMPVMIEHLPDREAYEKALSYVTSIWQF